MVPVISDFLFDDAGAVLGELGHLNSSHDVFIVLIDAAFAFELPPIRPAGSKLRRGDRTNCASCRAAR